MAKLEELVSREDFVNTYERKKVGNKKADILEHYGSLPLSIKSKNFKWLSRLGLFTYFSGAISFKEGKGYNSIINEDEKKIQLPIGEWKDNLGLILEKPRDKTTGKIREEANTYSFKENGQPYSRLLELMGFHVNQQGSMEHKNSKANTGARLPKYLRKMIDNYDDHTMESQRTVRKILRDFINIVFECKYRSFSKRDARLILNAKPDEDLAKEEAGYIMKAFNIIYPDAALAPENFRPIKNQGKHSGHIKIPLENLFALTRNAAPPVELIAYSRPSFGYNF